MTEAQLTESTQETTQKPTEEEMRAYILETTQGLLEAFDKKIRGTNINIYETIHIFGFFVITALDGILNNAPKDLFGDKSKREYAKLVINEITEIMNKHFEDNIDKFM